ncbi:duplicated homeodomain-like superfamily protein [Striga asiatica]|uniref:Duplicated homeodomain-like superfamily protein n=1 Tax=Striga asiatica TaxID=4170 RepID=A0A5A7PRQ7_STRAF|nr:duplicated homeodomain-like superfamily protein [Striga asiatica]
METLFPNSLVSSSGWLPRHGYGAAMWTKEENKKFESALAIFDENTPNRWFHVAAMIPGKTVYDVMNQYRELESDVSDIEAGLVPVPGYLVSSFTLDSGEEDDRSFFIDSYRKRARAPDHERKKGVPWTEDEHRRFLLGLKKHGKGDWRNISRNFVMTKTPTQVASHAQKYYLRQLSGGKDKRRPSIHDITTVDLKPDTTQMTNFQNKEKSNQLTNISCDPKTMLDWNHNGAGRYAMNIGACAPRFGF